MQTIETTKGTSSLRSWSTHIGTVPPKQHPAVAVAVVARKPENFVDRTFGLYFGYQDMTGKADHATTWLPGSRAQRSGRD